jgi:hypothetical protein
MTLLDLMDALQVHAAAAAVTAGGATFTDVAVGFPAAKGRCVRVFYGGERSPDRMGPDSETLNSEMVGQAVIVRGYWPIPETATKRQRVQEGEIGTFVKSFRTRVNGDKQLGGGATDLTLSLAVVEQVVVSGTKYTMADLEAVIDFDEYTIAP